MSQQPSRHPVGWAFILAAVSSIVLSNTVAQQCMGCTYDGTNAECGYLDITFVPVCLPPSTTFLHFVFNDLSTLQGDAFKDLTNMEHLNLGTCKINTLLEEVFSYMPNLFYLNLEQNEITYLPDNLFASNNKLSFLVLSDNNLTTINPVVLNPLPILGTLFAGSMNLQSIDDNRTFFYNTELGFLDLSYNNLKTMDKSLFSTNSYIDMWIAGNPWHCDCVITDLLAYFRSVHITFPPYFYPDCQTPPWLDGQDWTEIDPQPCSP